MSEFNYDILRLDVLIKLIDERGISCKNKKDEIIKYLKMDDEGKYIRETTYEKEGGRLLVGIDLKNQSHLVQMGKLVEKKEAFPKGMYASDRVYFISNQKLM
jgi:uncharacterized protein related to proFAR isomerase